jgi:hypothetical protein
LVILSRGVDIARKREFILVKRLAEGVHHSVDGGDMPRMPRLDDIGSDKKVEG